jgi:GH25 family lysozyme M1 (1,4-beta-N-acetylmuramidase)
MICALAVMAASPAGAKKPANKPGGGGGGGGTTVTRLPGIDVSHWQGTINWAQVAGAGIKFAIAKATESSSYVDPKYSTNKNGAAANGIKFTGYHFARPGRDGGTLGTDAIGEANHFTKVAALRSGNIIPALDLEATGGLGPDNLTKWVAKWLSTVSSSMGGVRPMIYTSPSFWKTYMGDTTQFADAGYKVLWIAHWTSNSAPTVPANNWGGKSWTFWQWTSCWSVSGITGCVDGDRYNGTDLTRVLIP